MKPNYFIREQWTKLTSGGTCTSQFPPRGVGGWKCPTLPGYSGEFSEVNHIAETFFPPPIILVHNRSWGEWISAVWRRLRGDLVVLCTFLRMGMGREVLSSSDASSLTVFRRHLDKLQGQPWRGQAAELGDDCRSLLTEISCSILCICKLLHIFIHIFQTVTNTAELSE